MAWRCIQLKIREPRTWDSIPQFLGESVACGYTHMISINEPLKLLSINSGIVSNAEDSFHHFHALKLTSGTIQDEKLDKYDMKINFVSRSLVCLSGVSKHSQWEQEQQLPSSFPTWNPFEKLPVVDTSHARTLQDSRYACT